MKTTLIRVLLTFVLFILPLANIWAASIDLAVLKYGTVNWELNVIKHHGLDQKHNIKLNITYLTNKNASCINKPIAIKNGMHIYDNLYLFIKSKCFNTRDL